MADNKLNWERDRKLVRLGLDLCIQSYPMTEQKIDAAIEAAGLTPQDVPEITMEELLEIHNAKWIEAVGHLASTKQRDLKCIRAVLEAVRLPDGMKKVVG